MIAFAEHDVGRFQIAMRDSFGVGGRDGVGKRDGDLEEIVNRQSAFRNRQRQRSPLDQLHREELEIA